MARKKKNTYKNSPLALPTRIHRIYYMYLRETQQQSVYITRNKSIDAAKGHNGIYTGVGVLVKNVSDNHHFLQINY